jgi:DNA-binding CsgD family transcriptional regulator
VVSAVPQEGWSRLFATAFKRSQNAMVLVDARRRVLDVNGAYLKLTDRPRASVVDRPLWGLLEGGPLASPEEWRASLHAGRFTGQANLLCGDGSTVAVQWAATTEIVTGRRLVLFVALSVSRWGRHFRRSDPKPATGTLSARELEIVRLIAMGASGPEIADELHISHDTVRTHVRNAMSKLGARSRAHLVAMALGNGLVLD